MRPIQYPPPKRLPSAKKQKKYMSFTTWWQWHQNTSVWREPHTRNKQCLCMFGGGCLWITSPPEMLKLEKCSRSFRQGGRWGSEWICLTAQRTPSVLITRLYFPTLNSYDSSIMTSSLECSPSTGFPISAIRLASSSSDVSFLSATSEWRGTKKARNHSEKDGRENKEDAQLISMLCCTSHKQNRSEGCVMVRVENYSILIISRCSI